MIRIKGTDEMKTRLTQLKQRANKNQPLTISEKKAREIRKLAVQNNLGVRAIMRMTGATDYTVRKVLREIDKRRTGT